MGSLDPRSRPDIPGHRRVLADFLDNLPDRLAAVERASASLLEASLRPLHGSRTAVEAAGAGERGGGFRDHGPMALIHGHRIALAEGGDDLERQGCRGHGPRGV